MQRFEVEVGGRSKADVLAALSSASVQLNAYAEILFNEPAFDISKRQRRVQLVGLSLVELGLPNGGRYDEIVAAAAGRRLHQCPLDVAPFLRLQYVDQPVGPYLTVASQKLRDDPTLPNGFYLRNIDGQLWLRGYESGPENHYAPDFTDFVFIEDDQ